VKNHLPSLSEASGLLGSPPIRNQATIGGNIINASPAADLVPPLIAHGATAHAISCRGHRSILVEDISANVNRTCLFSDEIVTHISVPIQGDGEGSAYFRLGLRSALTIAIASVSAWVKRSKGHGRLEQARIALGSVAPRVIRAHEAEAFLLERVFDSEAVKYAAGLARKGCKPISDNRATETYRKAMVYELTKMALKKAWEASNWANLV
jgi:CO/xanthine dehydrogenase FAD-binding subunit